MNYLSVCSGIEAATAAWHGLGWVPAGFSEIDAFPSAVLAHHYPDTPNYGDMTDHARWPRTNPDVLVGGTPCQSFSVAGLRKGMADPRGNLALVYLAIVDRQRPTRFVWENVPGVLSSNGGRDFGAFLGAVEQLGYGWAYRVLDAQFFGVAQRRRRVFVVGSSRGWRDAAAVLFDTESVSGNPAPRRETREKAAPTLAARTKGGGGLGTDTELDGALIPEIASTLEASDADKWGSNQWVDNGKALIANALTAHNGNRNDASDIINGHAVIHGTQDPDISDIAHPLAAINGGSVNAVAIAENQRGEMRETDVVPSLSTEGGKPGSGYPATRQGMRVRRLTPRECERLQGFPDDFTLIPYRNKPADQCPDGPRYKALGNSMAVPVMRWIGERIELVEALAA